jgi:hypothetical protein
MGFALQGFFRPFGAGRLFRFTHGLRRGCILSPLCGWIVFSFVRFGASVDLGSAEGGVVAIEKIRQ